MRGFEKRLALADSESKRAQDIFEKLEGSFLGAAQEQRQVYDDVEAEIQRLAEIRDKAMNAGLRNEERARKVRELFL